MALLGNMLLGPQPPINPFALPGVPGQPPIPAPMPNAPPPQMGPMRGPAAPPAAMASPASSAPPAVGDEGEARKGAWRTFIERFKSDPDMRLALLQMAIGMSQPADSPAAGVGQGLQAGMQTLLGLQNQRFEREAAGREEGRQDRRLDIEETRTGLEQQRIGLEGERVGLEGERVGLEGERLNIAREEMAQQDRQFSQNQQLQYGELAARLEQIRGDNQYKRDLVRLRRREVDSGGEQGQVNQRWTRLTNVLLQTQPQLFGDGEDARARAEAYAWDLMNSRQDRASMKSQIMSDGMIYIRGEPGTAEYEEGLTRLNRMADNILDASGLVDRRAFSAPAGGASPSQSQSQSPMNPASGMLQPGNPVSLRGQTGTIIQATDQAVTIQFQDGSVRVLNRQLVENELAGGGAQ